MGDRQPDVDGEWGRDMPALMTSTETAGVLRVPKSTMSYWRRVGKGPRCFKAGKHVLYAREDVLAFIEQARAADPSAAR